MEILHTGAKRTLLVVMDDNPESDRFCACLADDYNVLRAGSTAEGLEIMKDRIAGLSAVIVAIDMAEERDFAFLSDVVSDSRFDTIPVLVVSHRPVTDDDMTCFDKGAFDFISAPCHKAILKQRIDNAVQMKRATTFYEIESILRELPSNIFLKDVEGRYVFMTHYWRHLDKGDDPNWTIRGKTDLEIRKDRENAIKAMETDREIIKTGKGASYVVESNIDGIRDFMHLIKRPVFDENGNVSGIIALINDVTETELLKMDLEKRVRTDELTGLGNRRAFEEYVNSMAQTADYPVALISADCDMLKIVNDTYGHLVGDEYIRMSTLLFRVCLPETAHTFRMGGDEFASFVPTTTFEQAEELVEKMRDQCKLLKIAERSISVSFGIALVNGPKDNVYDVLAKADKAMYEDKALRRPHLNQPPSQSEETLD